jgi:GT2 family glycosyltransferase
VRVDSDAAGAAIALSVIVTTFDRPALLADQLAALARQEAGVQWEVVVADNGSDPATRAAVSAVAGTGDLDVKWIDASARRGVCFARNEGVRRARGRAVAFLDDDDIVADDWLAGIVAGLSEHAVVAARFDAERFNPPWVIAARGRPQESKLWTWYRTPDLPVAFGGTLAVQRELHEAIDGFDENLVTHEDADYSIRLRRLGHHIELLTDAVVYVRHRHSLRGTYAQARFYGEALPAFYRKHVPLGLVRPPRGSGLRGWASLVRSLLRIRDRSSLAVFVWNLGWRIGLVRGSVRSRYLLLSE